MEGVRFCIKDKVITSKWPITECAFLVICNPSSLTPLFKRHLPWLVTPRLQCEAQFPGGFTAGISHA
jgi:hypothetical protein